MSSRRAHGDAAVSDRETAMQQIDFRAMGCAARAIIDNDDVASQNALAQVPDWFDDYEDVLSRFRPSSELCALNAQAGSGQWVKVSDTLWQVLATAMRAVDLSQGLVVPTLLPAMNFIGYDRSFDALKAMPTVTLRVGPPPVLIDAHTIGRDGRTQTVRLPAGAQLDFGGIAKGWAAQQVAQRLSAHGPALVDIGGDIAVSGPRADDAAWPIGVANPFDLEHESELALLTLRIGSIATSGRDVRQWRNSTGQRLHHLIDPRTGWPAETDVVCATVVAEAGWVAEAGAKAALILGSAEGLAWLEDHSPDIAGALLVLADGRICTTAQWDTLLWRDAALTV